MKSVYNLAYFFGKCQFVAGYYKGNDKHNRENLSGEKTWKG